MGLLQKLKSALGLNGTESSESGRSGDVDVTVEREPSTEDEDAVKGTETASSGAATDSEDAAASDEDEAPSAEEFETLADETETAAPEAEETTEAEVAETATDAEAEETAAAEAEETAPEPEEAATDAEAAPPTEPEPDEETAAAEPDTADAVEGSDDPVTELNGIGPAYGDRLAGAGIETVGELAAADAAELAEQVALGESRVAGWIEQANEY